MFKKPCQSRNQDQTMPTFGEAKQKTVYLDDQGNEHESFDEALKSYRERVVNKFVDKYFENVGMLGIDDANDRDAERQRDQMKQKLKDNPEIVLELARELMSNVY